MVKSSPSSVSAAAFDPCTKDHKADEREGDDCVFRSDGTFGASDAEQYSSVLKIDLPQFHKANRMGVSVCVYVAVDVIKVALTLGWWARHTPHTHTWIATELLHTAPNRAYAIGSFHYIGC